MSFFVNQSLAKNAAIAGGISPVGITGARDLFGKLNIPGVYFKQLTADNNLPFQYDDVPDPIFNSPYKYSDVAAYIGDRNVAVLGVLKAIWKRIAKTSFYTANQIDIINKVLDAGVMAYPATADRLKILNASLPSGLYQPYFSDEKARQDWQKIIAEVNVGIAEYNKGNLAAGFAALAASESDVAFWDTFYNVVEAVRDAPGNALNAIGDAAAGVFFRPVFLIAGALVVIGFIAYVNKGKLLAKATSLAGKAI